MDTSYATAYLYDVGICLDIPKAFREVENESREPETDDKAAASKDGELNGSAPADLR